MRVNRNSGKGGSRSLQSATPGKVYGAALNSRVLALLAGLALIRLCDLIVIGTEGAGDQMRLRRKLMP